MDDQRFDRLTRKLASGTSRRNLLKLVTGGIAAAVSGAVLHPSRADADHVGFPGPNVSCMADSDCAGPATIAGDCTIGLCQMQIPPFIPGHCVYVPKPSSTVCRPVNGPCDRAEFCTGTSPDCPPDTFLSSNVQCASASGACAKPAFCPGNSRFCPPNQLEPAGTVCRASTGECEADGICTGSSSQCPPNALLTAGTVCREAVNDCDVSEVCTGASAVCPENAFAAAGTPCGADGDVCNGQETCDGSGACVSGAPLVCEEDDNPCTMAACDPSGGCIQVPVADNSTCNGTGACFAGTCLTCGNNQEVCNGRCRRKSSYNGDDRNCGACGHVCPDSHVCKGGFCRPL